MKDEWKFFLKYSGKQIINEFKNFGKGFRAIFRPKIWFFIFSAILIYQLWHKQSWAAIGGSWCFVLHLGMGCLHCWCLEA